MIAKNPCTTSSTPDSSVDVAVSLNGVGQSYPEGNGHRRILTNITEEIPTGFSAFTGPSGRGKSTLMNIIGALIRPTHGEVRVMGHLVPFDDPRALWRYRAEQVSWVFQDRNLIPHRSVVENVALPLLCAGAPRTEALDKAHSALERVGLGDRFGDYPATLSGGEQARCGIARATAARAPLILADEPTGSLDCDTADAVLDELERLVRDLGKSVLMVTHSERAALRADRVYALSPTALIRTHASRFQEVRP